MLYYFYDEMHDWKLVVSNHVIRSFQFCSAYGGTYSRLFKILQRRCFTGTRFVFEFHITFVKHMSIKFVLHVCRHAIVEDVQECYSWSALSLSILHILVKDSQNLEYVVSIWRGWCSTLKTVVWNFEDGGVVLWRRWCGTLKRVVWNF